MTVSVSKAGPYFASGEIKFSDLRKYFRSQIRKTTSGGSETFSTDTAAISASELLRDTGTSITNPNVPDCTENRTTVSVSPQQGIAATQSNWKVSQFRNSIKYYYIAQSSTNTNFDIDAQSWNSNLDKNINKFMFIDGLCGSTSTSSAAVSFDATGVNLLIDVTGNIRAAGGAGGIGGSVKGKSGGDAVQINLSSGSQNVVLLARTGSTIYGGGGGGGKGLKGADGSGGTCNSYDTSSDKKDIPDCALSPNPSYVCSINGYSGNNGSNHSGAYCGSPANNAWWIAKCYNPTSTNGGTGGAGGDGGNGRGYLQAREDGDDGAGGTGGGGCGATSGKTGKTGGDGGTWGEPGESQTLPVSFYAPGTGGLSIKGVSTTILLKYALEQNESIKGGTANSTYLDTSQLTFDI